MRLLCASVAVLAPWAGAWVVGSLPVVANAAAPASEPADELRAELERLARRNAWGGVEETYRRLVALGPTAAGQAEHMLGFRAAEQLGLTTDARERLAAAQAVQPSDEAEEALNRIERTFAPVYLRGSWRRRPLLVRERLPFAPDQRASIEHAKSVVEETGSFRGWLPEGQYLVGDQLIELVAGQPELEVDLRRPSKVAPVQDAAARGAGFQSAESAVRYAGPVIAAGAGGLWSPPSGAAGAVEPASHLGGGVQAQVGAEVGFSRAFAVAPTLGYQGSWSASQGAHQLTGAFAAVLRRGRVRVALGPSFGVALHRGYGVADSLSRDEDGDPRTNEQLLVRGAAWGGGVSLGLGFGVADLGALLGQTELVVQWQGGARDYLGLGLRFALVPAVPKQREIR
jgi:hypothetical protein